MTAVVETPKLSPFSATRDQPCTAGHDCGGVKAGEPAAYVGWTTGPGAVCSEARAEIEARVAALADPPVEQLAGNVHPVVAELQVDTLRAAMDQAGRVDVSQLAEQTLRELAGRGLILRGADGVWSVTTAGYGALGEEIDEHGWPQDVDAAGYTADQRDEDRVAALAAAEDDVEVTEQGDDDVQECTCARVTKRAAFGRTADGRPTHEHCGGVLREKHRHLAPEPEQTESTDGEAQSDDRDHEHPRPHADSAFAGEPAGDPDPGAGVEARPADGAARAGEGGGAGGEGASAGDRGRDQGGDRPGGPGSAVGADPQPAHADAVEGRAAGRVAARLEAAAGGSPADVGGVREEDRQQAPRPGEVALGLAAFYAAPPEGDEPPLSLADFYAAPSEVDDAEAPYFPGGGEGVTPATLVEAGIASRRDTLGAGPDSDNFLGEFSVPELLDEIARRDGLGAAGTRVAGVLMADEAHGVEWIVRVPR